jgi:cell fate regulator YaaT (PSP1 superfamily)
MKAVGVSFRACGKVYDFDPGQLELKPGEQVVVDTARGQELGEVVLVKENEAGVPLKAVLRIAGKEDIQKCRDLKTKGCTALEECTILVIQLGLPMKLISADYSLDEAHLTVYFSAEGRVDFRELVRDLGHKLHVRVELRQIGPRDEAKILGGYGRCGCELCCTRFLADFNPVAIKMAKMQDLPLNPMKISGVCGRLLCCLGYECEQYREIKEKMPREGTRVMTDAGPGVIVGHNALGEKAMVEYETGARLEIPLARVRVLDAPSAKRSPGGTERPGQLTPANSPPETSGLTVKDGPPETEPPDLQVE